jgi:hypothetical protein
MKKLLYPAAVMAFLCQSLNSEFQNFKTESIFNWGKFGWELPAVMVADDEVNYYISGSFSIEMFIK